MCLVGENPTCPVPTLLVYGHPTTAIHEVNTLPTFPRSRYKTQDPGTWRRGGQFRLPHNFVRARILSSSARDECPLSPLFLLSLFTCTNVQDPWTWRRGGSFRLPGHTASARILLPPGICPRTGHLDRSDQIRSYQIRSDQIRSDDLHLSRQTYPRNVHMIWAIQIMCAGWDLQVKSLAHVFCLVRSIWYGRCARFPNGLRLPR